MFYNVNKQEMIIMLIYCYNVNNQVSIIFTAPNGPTLNNPLEITLNQKL